MAGGSNFDGNPKNCSEQKQKTSKQTIGVNEREYHTMLG